MLPKVELSKIRGAGEVIDDSVLFIKQNWQALLKTYFTICGLFWVSSLVASTFNMVHALGITEPGQSRFTWIYFTSIFIEVINHTILLILTLSFIVLYKDNNKQAPSVEQVWVYVKYYFIRVFSSYFLLAAILVAGFVCCFIPGVYLLPVFALILTVMVLENASLQQSWKRGFYLIKEKWGSVFGVAILSVLLIMIALLLILIPAMLVALIYVFLTGSHSYSPYWVAFSVSIHLAEVLYLLPYIAIALMYYSLVEQTEDLTILQRIEMLGKADETTPDEPMHEEEY